MSLSKNNGVIAITRCANRGAGRWCCGFLILFGILGKLSGVFLASALFARVHLNHVPHSDSHFETWTVPNPVLGGVTTFLFASVAVSGLRVLSYIRWARRERIVLAGALSFGLGDILVPGIFQHLFDRVRAGKSAGLLGLFDSITIVLSTPCE
jgi:uric acid-xanthine permease